MKFNSLLLLALILKIFSAGTISSLQEEFKFVLFSRTQLLGPVASVWEYINTKQLYALQLRFSARYQETLNIETVRCRQHSMVKCRGCSFI